MFGDRTVGYFCRYLPSLRSPEVFGLLFQSTCIGFFALKVAIAGNAPAVVRGRIFSCGNGWRDWKSGICYSFLKSFCMYTCSKMCLAPGSPTEATKSYGESSEVARDQMLGEGSAVCGWYRMFRGVLKCFAFWRSVWECRSMNNWTTWPCSTWM